MTITPTKNTIYNRDCLELMCEWDDNSFDHCITDPPYNMSKDVGLDYAFSAGKGHTTMEEKWDQFTREEYLEFSKAWIGEVTRLVKPNGNILIFGSYHNIYTIGYILQELDLKILNSIIWHKPNAQPNITRRMLIEGTEQLIWACNGSTKKATKWIFNYEDMKLLNGGTQMRNLWIFPYTSHKEKEQGQHPNQKPLQLVLRLVLMTSLPGDLILDPFAGSGTTGIVAKAAGRKCVMIEQDPGYFEMALARLATTKVPPPPEFQQAQMDFGKEKQDG